MYMFPGAVLPLPDARFFKALGECGFVRRNSLIEPHVSDHADVAHDSDLGSAQGCVETAFHSTQVEIETMKFQAFDKMAGCLWFKRSERWITQLLVRRPVGCGNRVQQALGQLQQFRFAVHDSITVGQLRR
jgi:hypothetical protein